jgi:hypothetical protein
LRIELHIVGWRDYRPWKAKSGNVAGSLAWSWVDDAGVGHVAVRAMMQWLLWALARLGHEIEHCLDPTFGNEEHHPFSHQCLRSYSPRRSWKHAAKATPQMARDLREHGLIAEVPG